MTDTVMTFCCPHCGTLLYSQEKDVSQDTRVLCWKCSAVFTILNPSFEKDTLCTTRVIRAGVNAK